MSEKDSSITRVAPLGEFIMSNHSLVDKLLSLLSESPALAFGEFSNESVFYKEHPVNKEKALKPTVEHLLGIIDKIENDRDFREYVQKNDSSTSTNKVKRELLFHLDTATLKEAKEKVRTDRASKSWYIFEGISYPDLFIENEQYILLVEGKRTEPNKTSQVAYLPNRSQMVRHIENTLNYCKGQKKVIAFYIVEESCSYKDKCASCDLLNELKAETIQKSDELNKKIVDSFYGYTTWQQIAKKLGVKFSD